MTKLVISASQLQSQFADLLPVNQYRKSQLTYELIKAYGLLEFFDDVLDEPIATRRDIEQFHGKPYLDIILDEALNSDDGNEIYWEELRDLTEKNDKYNINHISELLYRYQRLCGEESDSESDRFIIKKRKASELSDEESEVDSLETFGLNGDSPLFWYLPLYCLVTAGSTLSLVRHVLSGERSICINWDGGRHHAMKNRASGFCYVNDIVLLIMQLRKSGVDKVSYIDFDLHHGDGVEKAFQYSKKVQTVSIHMYEPGFFPCTGSIEDSQRGKSIVNVPVKHGLDDESLTTVTKEIVLPAVRAHGADIVVIQCGGDGLRGDKYKEWQLSIRGLTANIMSVIESFPKTSVVLLGGGGYNHLLMSRFHAYLTWRVVQLCRDIPGPPAIEEEEDTLLPDHPLIDIYAPEQYKFWYYDHGGDLRNSNNIKSLVTSIHKGIN